MTWAPPASRFLCPTWLSLQTIGGPVPHLSLAFPSISPVKRLGQQLLWGRASPFMALLGRRSSRGECGRWESSWVVGSTLPEALQRCPGLNLHLHFWQRAGKHFHFVSEFVTSDPKGGEREALNDCSILPPVFHKGFLN